MTPPFDEPRAMGCPEDRDDRSRNGLGPCGICGANAWLPRLITNRVQIVRCRACTAGRTVPTPVEADGREHFSEDELYYQRFYEEQRAFRQALAVPALALLQRFKPSGRVLEVGCGVGFFMKHAAQHGYSCRGIDASPAATAFARAVLDLDVRTGDFLHTPLDPADVFDAVVMNHVIEHVGEPVRFLERAHGVLSTRGIVLVGCPNFDGWMPRLLGDRWDGLQPSQHRWQFTPQSLASLLTRAGFAVEEVRIGSLHYGRGPGWKTFVLWTLARIAEATGHGDNLLAVGRRA